MEKLSQLIILPFPFGMGTYVHHSKYQDWFPFFTRVPFKLVCTDFLYSKGHTVQNGRVILDKLPRTFDTWFGVYISQIFINNDKKLKITEKKNHGFSWIRRPHPPWFCLTLDPNSYHKASAFDLNNWIKIKLLPGKTLLKRSFVQAMWQFSQLTSKTTTRRSWRHK